MNTENNKIIAEFMGIADEIETGATSLIQIEGITGYYKNDNLKYHSDWNWLMEVVEKIESLGNVFSIDNKKVYILNDVAWCTAQVGETKIQAVYNACLEFSKWYNEQII